MTRPPARPASSLPPPSLAAPSLAARLPSSFTAPSLAAAALVASLLLASAAPLSASADEPPSVPPRASAPAASSSVAAPPPPVAGPASASASAPAPAPAPEAAPEEPIFVDMEGRTVRVSDHRGHVLLLNFWATYCGPCRVEMPELQALHAELGPRGLRVIGAAANGRQEGAAVRSVLDERGVTFPSWLWVSAKDMRHYGVGPGIPATVLFDRDGRVVARWPGMVTAEQVRPQVLPLLR